METKICTKCKKEKKIEEFKIVTGTKRRKAQCKQCDNEYNKIYRIKNKEKEQLRKSKYYQEHKEQLKEKRKQWIEENREKYLEYKKQYHLKHKEEEKQKRKEFYNKNKEKMQKKNRLRMRELREKDTEKFRKYNREYRQKNIEKIKKREQSYKKIRNLRQKERIENEPTFRFKRQIRSVIRQSFKRNYGYEYDNKEQVHIDHIIPLVTAKTEKEVIKLCHYTNLQLLKAEDNLRKNKRIDFKLDEGN